MTATIQLISPVDGRVYAERPYTTPAQIEQALQAAASAQAQWQRRPLSERAAFCNAVVDAMLGMKDQIVPELAWQMGRPVRFGAGELRGFEERARHMIAIAAQALAVVEPSPVAGFRRFIKRDPLGTVLVVAPWNYPYLTAVNSIIPALMAGNSVILKHASQTLLVGERFAEAMHRAHLPEGLFHNLLLSHTDTGAMIASGRVQQVNFTGSVDAGKAMESAATGRFLGLGLELGGKDPAYVRADANLEHAVENLVDGSFFNSGQSCCAVERIYVDEKIYPAFVEGFAALTRQYVLGNPLDEATTLGPMVTPGAAMFVRGQIAEALAQGARALIDPQAFAADVPGGAYLAPQVLVDVSHQMSVMRDESFGPVVGIMPVKGDDQAIALMNDSEFGLSASIWTRDLDAAERLGEQVDTGTLFMNRCDYLDPALAWTGVKNSGRGVTLSSLGYEHLTRAKSFHLRHEI
ncbi:aldehyde dehydrogenase family protein [Pseudomonas vancouverensis]|uniref:Aldehyde dehydrogenase family protein n=1 Tax=Pseudomonas vancouverensis TaxID=95300 RepID=A0A1H2NQ40_PSEVA|nr:aldehyde dehydrogenase family protein [Pseudomonas vancouverensis]KAB0491251.1 aldehyde dehydrogenase family protein [Pseudomonas vancouverensis]TDB64284.1 aldehyde dehydrogenase family protein [Pseudomonas vancouverensis]SDV07582.1 Acyl-CoA reductase [Pseudomonas vancouverensis]